MLLLAAAVAAGLNGFKHYTNFTWMVKCNAYLESRHGYLLRMSEMLMQQLLRDGKSLSLGHSKFGLYKKFTVLLT